MDDQEVVLINMQGEAALEAHDALRASVECLPHALDLAGGHSEDEVMLMLGFMFVYQLSMESQRITRCLDDLCASIEAKATDFWMISDLAAIDKAKAIGLDIYPEWSIADLRYKLHQAIYGGEHG